ncbi:MAG TPA: sulfatase [Bryobacteraceae bacterium]|jgi:membrane-anchored protein YejM (alkaline phosphatase superfamily)
MRALGLLFVFVVAKVAMVAGHSIALSPWTPLAYFWQDVLVAGVFAVLDRTLPKPASRIIYWGLVLYAAINIPVARAVSSPLTWPMLRAARGPLSDSFLVYLTWQNLALMALVLLVAGVPEKMPEPSRGRNGAVVILALLALALGPLASARIETLGLHRNPILALISVPGRSQAHADTAEGWQASLAAATAEDLSALRGIARGRNIVMVSLESTAAQYLSLYGSEYEVTPNLTALAHHAVVFENAYAVYPESIKGLYSVLCSAFPTLDSQPEAYENVPCNSIASELARAGYHTAMFHSGRFDYLGMQSIIRNRGYQTLEDAGAIGGNRNSSFGVDEPSTVARMLSWIDALPRGQRFALTYLPIAGHHPYETPERGPFPERQEIGRYRNALLYGDAALGTLIDGLRTRGLADSTVWIIYGDHGEAFGQHEGNYAHTFFIYDENVHVPLLIAAPGQIPGQTRVRKVVSLVDVAPTILDLTGLQMPSLYQGHSMLDSLPRMALFFTDYSLKLAGVRDGPWKLIQELDSGRAKLFNLERDPRETTDISRENPELAARYRHVILESGFGVFGKPLPMVAARKALTEPPPEVAH